MLIFMFYVNKTQNIEAISGPDCVIQFSNFNTEKNLDHCAVGFFGCSIQPAFKYKVKYNNCYYYLSLIFQFTVGIHQMKHLEV